MSIDYKLLIKQRDFLLEYPWRGKFPEEIAGIVNLLDSMIDDHLDSVDGGDDVTF